jgi:hypothetical protein
MVFAFTFVVSGRYYSEQWQAKYPKGDNQLGLAIFSESLNAASALAIGTFAFVLILLLRYQRTSPPEGAGR